MDRDAEWRRLERKRRWRQRERRRLWRNLLIASLAPWIALVGVGAPFDDFRDLAGWALGQLSFALIGGVMLLVIAGFLRDMWFWLRYGCPPGYFG